MVSADFTIPQAPRLELSEFVALMGTQNRAALQRILDENRGLFQRSKGSRANHHSWPGGYWDHITECLNLALAQYSLWSALRPLDYLLSEAYEVLFIHDIEKPWKYEPDAPCPIAVPEFTSKPLRAAWRLELLEWYGIKFSPAQQNALEFCECEIEGYSADQRAMQPLAHLCHTCDETSARQFPEDPSADKDSWRGAHRIALVS